MVVSNTIFSNLFGGQNVRPKSTNTEKQAFKIDPYADIADAEIKTEFAFAPFRYTQNSQNNPENPERFSTQRDNLDFSKSVFSSQVAAGNIAQASVSNGFSMPSRLSGNDSRGSLRPFNLPNQKEEFFGAKLALTA
jgi:hypothetical protein